MKWWERLILERYETHGMGDRYDAAGGCLDEIRAGRWRVFEYPDERVVAIVGHTNTDGIGEVHMWADEGHLRKFIRMFMRDVWLQTDYMQLVGIFVDSRMERFVSHFGWTYFGSGSLGERYWTISR